MAVENRQDWHVSHAASQIERERSNLEACWVVMADQIFAYVLSIVILIVTLPLMALAFLATKLASRGPMIYSQLRLGREGHPFRIFKIRSMYHNCENTTGPQWSKPGDPRITPVGRILRITHLDELPQLWNVLRGDMTLVGPRPERPEIAIKLESALPQYGKRTQVLPGLTGLAQVQLPPDTDLDSVRRKLVCDLEYLERRSPWLDLRILVATATGILGIPFSITGPLLRIPSLKQIEQASDVSLNRQSPCSHPFDDGASDEHYFIMSSPIPAATEHNKIHSIVKNDEI